MYNLAHVCYGFNPGARLTGVMVEDERVWGGTEWGIGYQAAVYNGKGRPSDAVSHADGTCLSCSVSLDDKQVIADGKLVDSELKALARKFNRE